MDNKKTIYIVLGVIIIAALVAVALYVSGVVKPPSFKEVKKADKPRVIEENLVIPDTKNIVGTEARMITDTDAVDVPLVPKNEGEKVIVAKAVLTIKGAYYLAAPEAQSWSDDATPVFIKSLGAVTLEGKSSQWQIAFASADKKAGYEVVIQGDKIVSQKEIESTILGAALPENLKDSDTAIVALQELPQFSDATISSINLYYNTDGKVWRYTLSTSRGTTSMAATQ